ncbi:hypothetical protein [Curvivirga aplysinae]|uniref:hypothetical protein n=1 Tax=Curvivirga aplysinae TaxID=2529852 RepID=UPI0012BD3124|nr:hypothetical protein [Curvivirga aplysinae]MTI09513.1 hypothetical protein [Curvivirga aplysinae]
MTAPETAKGGGGIGSTKGDFGPPKGRGEVAGLGSEGGYDTQRMRGPSPEELARRKRERELQLKRERFKQHREKAATRKDKLFKVEGLDDAQQGQINKSLTTMKKYRDQSGMAKWDIQEVKDNPQAGLSRIAAIREGLEDDEETYHSYLEALRAQLKGNHYSLSVLDVTSPENKGQKFRGDLNKGFRMLTARL